MFNLNEVTSHNNPNLSDKKATLTSEFNKLTKANLLFKPGQIFHNPSAKLDKICFCTIVFGGYEDITNVFSLKSGITHLTTNTRFLQQKILEN